MRLLRTLAPVACLLAVVVTRPAPFAALTAGAEGALHRTMGERHILCRLYLDPHDKFTRTVAPPRKPLATGQVEAPAVLSTITVNYAAGFTTEARTAFQAAVDLWATQVQSSVPITVNADFLDLGNPLLLGQAGATCAFRDFGGAPVVGTWFPNAIANRNAGSDLLPAGSGGCSDPSDIGADFNSAANWYYGTDGNVPAGQVDFESVVLHELGHGLGFFGSASISGANGEIGSSGFPYIYDRFAVDALTGGSSLLNTTAYPNPGTALSAALRGNSLFWDGTSGKAANSGVRPKLFAPSTFSGGSTYSHLDETTYPPGNINSLMTPSIGSAESIHTPGPLTAGIFADMGWNSSTGSTCSFGLDRTTASVAAAGGPVLVTLSTSTGCAWTASTAATFVTIAPAASGTGSRAFTLTVAANPGLSQRIATVTIGGQTLTITQVGTGPAMSIDKAALIFGAVSTGAAFSSQTGSQVVRLTQTGTGTVTWTASSATPWLLVSPTSGSGPANLAISTQFAASLAATQQASITLTFTGAGNTAGPIAVTLNVLTAPAAAAPQGAFDTPGDGTTGVTGSIAVTGWAVDDVQVTRVRILRDPVGSEAEGVLVPIGDAVLVDGARPDVAALFPAFPQNTRAGWGYLMLTNFLPGQGNGTFRLHAIADDADGHSTALGTKTITCTNATATTPFGAIDTPAQGGTVSGSSVLNFGWVLSRNPARADPPGGGTVRVVIDGAFIAQVPSGWTAREDLTGLFPSAGFAGIGTALAVAGLDTTTLTNGVHTLSWVVTDNVGGAAGIGSRYFTVANGALHHEPSEPDAPDAVASTSITGPATLSMPRAAALRFNSAASLAGEIAGAEADVRAIEGRRGYDVNAPRRSFTFRDGVATIQSEELDRIELHLKGVEGGRRREGVSHAGYLRANGVLTPLPIGSSLNAATGEFTWQPGVGFVGSYDLVFVRWANGRAAAKQDVRIVLNPKGSNRVGPQVVIDTPGAQDGAVSDGFIVAGWATDLDSTVDSGVDAVHVWAYPAGGADPIFVGEAAVGGRRPDVAAIFGERFEKSGYGIEVKGLAPGTYDIAVFAYSTVTGGFVPAKTVRVTVR